MNRQCYREILMQMRKTALPNRVNLLPSEYWLENVMDDTRPPLPSFPAARTALPFAQTSSMAAARRAWLGALMERPEFDGNCQQASVGPPRGLTTARN
jgi:hypothetical protein